MSFPVEIAAARSAEDFFRGLAWQRHPPALCGVPVRHFTPRMRLDLELSGNAFVVGGWIREHDVFAFLWRLHRAYRPMPAPAWLRRARRLPAALRALLAFRAPAPAWAYEAIRRRVARQELVAAVHEIHEYLARVYQDRPAGALAEEGALAPKARPHWCDDFVEFFAVYFHYGREAVLETPFVQLHQLWRAWALARGVEVIDPHAALVADYAARALAAYREEQYAAAPS